MSQNERVDKIKSMLDEVQLEINATGALSTAGARKLIVAIKDLLETMRQNPLSYGCPFP